MTNREIINGMGNEDLGKFLTHIDCACCAYYSEDGPHVCSKLSQKRTTDIRDCAEGRAKWLDREADFRMADYIRKPEERTVKDILDTMTEEERLVARYLLGVPGGDIYETT